MARAFGSFCCFIVGLQLLVGVPVAVCLLFFAMFGGLGPIAIEVHPGPSHAPHMLVQSATIAPPSAPLTLAPPPNVIPSTAGMALDNPILETRAQQGSPLAGTVLSEDTPPNVERDLFVAAFQKVAAAAANESSAPPPTINALDNNTTGCSANGCCEAISIRRQADEFAIQHLYEIADMDERSANYQRADQWRALAREIRQADQHAPSVLPPIEGSSAEAPPLDLP